ncbi:MAG: carbohydrate ABC transporter permease [Chloroflexota bacterium]
MASIFRGKRRSQTAISQLFLNLTLIVISSIWVVPVLVLISASFTDEKALTKNGFRLWPSQFSTDAYYYLMRYPQAVLNAYGISIIVTILGTLGTLLVVVMLAYPLSRVDFKWRRPISFIVFFTMLFNGGIIANYIWIANSLHMVDSILALTLPIMVNTWFVFLMRSYFSELPREFIEAAKIDGANEWQILFQIVLPLSVPALATIALFSIMMYWNDWWQALLFIRNRDMYPLQYWLYTVLSNAEVLNRTNVANLGLNTPPLQSVRMAVAVLAMGPISLAFLALQRYFIRGITLGGVKG